MIVLGLDTAQGACSAALVESERTLAARSEEMEIGHAEALAPMIERLLAEAGISPSAIVRIGCTVGPGTFTGLRVALSLARAMALALSIPVIGVTTLKALAAAAFGAAPSAPYAAAAIDARRGELYFQIFAKPLSPVSQPEILALDAALARLLRLGRTKIALAGTGASLIAEKARGFDPLVTSIRFPSAVDVALIAASANDYTARPPEPLYLRAPDAKLPSAAKPLRPPRPRR